MVRASHFFALIVVALFTLLPPVVAFTVVYVASDPGDIPLYNAISNRTGVLLSKEPSGNLIVALDVNYAFLNGSDKDLPVNLIGEAKKGKTVIVGLNTLRAVEKVNPRILEFAGIQLNYTTVGILPIEPNGLLKFEKFGYDSDRYGLVIVRARNSKVLLDSGGMQIVTEISLGKGKLVVVGINPTAYYLDTSNPGVVEFVVSLIDHYSRPGSSRALLVGGALGAAVLAGYAATSNNPHVQRFRELIKSFPVIVIGRFLTPPAEVLQNSTRRGIYEYIKAKGYSTLIDVVSTFGISRTNAKWHLRVLTRAKLLEETNVGNTIVFHPIGKKEEAIKLFLLENKTRKRIYELIIERPMGVSELSRLLGVSKSTVHHNLTTMEEYGLVRKREDGVYEAIKSVSGEKEHSGTDSLSHGVSGSNIVDWLRGGEAPHED
ncbi:Transcriptional regulator, ArsR family [Thermococcus sp. 2319x1]|uniref:helix-turn-helix domain-containing protein n=1 Tax=Thermococcus sp. 2319x1 TaxID=1674923 RepID=UPI00073A7E6F|nr:helix-turn-helix domain-containing protein [Thermococcus sp. 2319x1]ALV63704.1 Transcriptional regulator, ArsR family [Thermococcus sp. 2319x1]